VRDDAYKPIEDFWNLSPAQVSFYFDAKGYTQPRGKASDLLRLVRPGRGAGVQVETGEATSSGRERGLG
jgi:hypothetical protein